MQSGRSAAASHPGDKTPDVSVGIGSGRIGLPIPALVADDWEHRWHDLMSLPDSPERTKQLMAMLEQLGQTDPTRAIAFADKATADAYLRADFLQAAVRGWASGNPDAAIAWANSQTLMDQGQAMSAVFHGAARDPENALRLAAQLSAQDPEHAGDYGSYVIAALNRVGEFDRATAFAADAPEEFRLNLMNAAYTSWGESNPQAAMEAIGQLSDPETKRTAFNAAISGWSRNDPGGVADYALSLPEGDERTFALTVALRLWSADDPVGAATWMNGLDSSPELDFGAAVVASQPDAIRQPDIAIGWANSIIDPQLRVSILATVVNQWAAVDPVAAWNYVETSPSLEHDERTGLLAALEPDFTPPASILP